MDKSYVTIAQRVCMFCGKVYDSGDLLLDRRLKPTFEKYTVVGIGCCPKDKELFEEKDLIGVFWHDENSGDYSSVVVSSLAFEKIFDVEAPVKRITQAEKEVIEHLEMLAEKFLQDEEE